MTEQPLLILLGTKAQYIKTAPILRELDKRGLPYRLVYSGQHSETFTELERAFGSRTADEVLVPGTEAATKATLFRWALRFWVASCKRLLSGGWRGARIMLVHGDTVSTLFGALLGRIGRMQVAHVEAGLRSPDVLDPFPEELVRRWVSIIARLHFAPDSVSASNLTAAKGTLVVTEGNTLRDALQLALRSFGGNPEHGGGGGYAVFSVHRNENLSRRQNLEAILESLLEVSTIMAVKFVMHPATREKLIATGWHARLSACPNVALLERCDYPTFVRLLVGSRCLFTDGGSNQEEAAMLGLPTILLRRQTERRDGIGDNITLSELSHERIVAFAAERAGKEWRIRDIPEASPSVVIVDALQRSLQSAIGAPTP